MRCVNEFKDSFFRIYFSVNSSISPHVALLFVQLLETFVSMWKMIEKTDLRQYYGVQSELVR